MNSITYKPGWFWGLLAIGALLLLLRLGATPIYILDEAKNAECAREMLQRQDVITPVFNGELRPDKPPLHYFFMMAAYKVLGTTPFAARFFSVVMGLLTVLVTYIYTKKFLVPFAAFCAAAVLLASPHFLFEFRLAVPDPYLIFFLTLGLFSAFAWVQQNNSSQLYISAVALALAILAKGPVALALPGLCVLVWVVLSKKWRILFNWRLLIAAAIVVIIAAPWYLAVDKATNGEWTRGFFIDNNLNRFSDPQEGHGGLFIVTPLFVIIGLLPFTGFLAEIIKRRKLIFQHAIVKFSGIVVLVFVTFFSIASTRLPNYPMPCYPFAAIVLGSYIAALVDGQVQSKKYPFFIVLVFSAVAAVAGYFAIGSESELRFLQWLPLLLLVCPVVLLAGYVLWPKRWSVIIPLIVIGYWLFNAIGLQVVYPQLYQQNPVAKTIDFVKQHKNIAGFALFNPAYRFYLDSNLLHTGDTAVLRQYIKTHNNVIVITRADYTNELKTLPLREAVRHRDIFELPTTVIYSAAGNP